MSLRWSMVWVLAAAANPAWAEDERQYALDPVHTRVVIGVSHAGFSQAVGTISGSTGTVRFDREDWRGARLDVTVPVDRLDLGDAKWNAAALAANLLDAQRHPQARFVSSTVEPVDAEHARVCGELTLRGVTRPQCLDVTLNALKRHPLPPFRRTAGFSASATLSRKEFGITAWPSVIGDAVTLRIEAEAVLGQPPGASEQAGDVPGTQAPTTDTGPAPAPEPEATPSPPEATEPDDQADPEPPEPDVPAAASIHHEPSRPGMVPSPDHGARR
jgi:polyisoprenoid-binding protein YceI